MRILQPLSIALFLVSAAWAAPTYPIQFQDALASQNAADVIGDPNLFDIDYLRIANPSANTLQIDIRFNFGGGASLSAFSISGFNPLLNVGDLFFRTASATYAFVLNAHDGLSANRLYTVTATQTAQTVLGNPSGTYRNNAEVWASPAGAQLVSTGSSSVVTVNSNSTNLLATLTVPLSVAAMADFNNGFDVYFASATCGNDEITGTVPASAVPEPGTWATLGAGLIAAGLYRRKRQG